ncbi:MAG: conjugal transfer protein TraG N-terminal domain-containing protein [Pseudomonadales bacterium]|uniref:conjugal transfer protein TraG N-terminal domain-containing protein n=1 Tax=Moritella sp. TaxID=78556 RepID=UPI001D7D2F74|nr:conjugal transfer protein TraG N-terminal domain-containing protein [Moritella sp.]MCJ8315210.1 conjugal transfer protein TraG N-terminal domain-containing protein [Pseudomonadales bacterium]NQZ49356.1 conjugal transfer protein TraG N-terminal domain-containing protein [Moritella sp.]
MTMIVNTAMEAYTMTLGFFLNNRIWDLLNMTGIAFLPIIIAVVKAFGQASAGGDDEGNKGIQALKHVEVDFMRIIPVMILCVFPLGPEMKIETINYASTTCAEANITNSIVGGGLDSSVSMYNKNTGYLLDPRQGNATIRTALQRTDISINGTVARPQIWFGIVQNMSTRGANAIIATIPCESDIVGLSMQIASSKMKSEDMNGYTEEFAKQCYIPAMASLASDDVLSFKYINENIWVGHDAFTGVVGGIYDKMRMKFSPEYWGGMIAQSGAGDYSTPIDQQENLDYNLNDALTNPSCSDGYKVLRSFLKRDFSVEMTDLDKADIAAGKKAMSQSSQYSYLTKDPDGKCYQVDPACMNPVDFDSERVQLNQLIGRSLLNEAKRNNPGESINKDGKTNNNAFDKTVTWVGDLTTIFLSAETYGSGLIEARVQKLAIPMYLLLIQTVFFIAIPILMVFSGYSFGMVLTISVTIFGLEFIMVMFEIARWFDFTLARLTASGWGDISDTSQVIMKLVQLDLSWKSYVILPVLWATLLGTVGFITHMTMGGAALGNSAGQGAANAAKAALTQAKKDIKNGIKDSRDNAKAKGREAVDNHNAAQAK